MIQEWTKLKQENACEIQLHTTIDKLTKYHVIKQSDLSEYNGKNTKLQVRNSDAPTKAIL